MTTAILEFLTESNPRHFWTLEIFLNQNFGLYPPNKFAKPRKRKLQVRSVLTSLGQVSYGPKKFGPIFFINFLAQLDHCKRGFVCEQFFWNTLTKSPRGVKIIWAINSFTEHEFFTHYAREVHSGRISISGLNLC